MHYFISKKNYCHFNSQVQKFNINEGPSLPILSSLVAAQPGGSPARQQRTTSDLIKLYIFYNCICEAKRQILFFVNKTMHNFKIGYNFVEHFLNLYFGRQK